MWSPLVKDDTDPRSLIDDATSRVGDADVTLLVVAEELAWTPLCACDSTEGRAGRVVEASAAVAAAIESGGQRELGDDDDDNDNEEEEDDSGAAASDESRSEVRPNGNN